MAYKYYFYPTKNVGYNFGYKDVFYAYGSDYLIYKRTSYDCSYMFSDSDMSVLSEKIKKNICSNAYLYLNCSNVNTVSITSKNNLVYFKGSSSVSDSDVSGSTVSGDFSSDNIVTYSSYTNSDNYTYNLRIKLNLSYLKANLNNCKYGFTILNQVSSNSELHKDENSPKNVNYITTIQENFNTYDMCLCIETTETPTTYNYTVKYTDEKGHSLSDSTYTYFEFTTTPSVYPTITVKIKNNKFNDVTEETGMYKYIHVGWNYTNSSGVTKFISFGGDITLNRATETLSAVWNTVTLYGNNVPFSNGTDFVSIQSYLINNTTYKKAIPFYSDGELFYAIMSVSSSNST